MKRVQAGETRQLGLLYERYKKRLFGYFYKLSGDQTLSEDLVQNVFVKVLKYKDSYVDDHNFTAWLFRIARNVNIDHHRKHSRHYHDELDSVAYGIADSESLMGSIEQRDEGRLLSAAIDRLDSDKREVLILSKYKELKYKEVAQIVGSTEGAVKVKVHRALNELRDIYKGMRNR